MRKMNKEVDPQYMNCPIRSLMPHVSALIGWALEHFDEIAK